MIQEVLMLRTHDGNLIKIWSNRHGGWEYSEDAKCYIYHQDFHTPPSSYCLGERMIYCDYGLDSYGVLWMGSTDDGWHDYNFGYDLTKAIHWVRECKYPELQQLVWGTDAK